MSYSSVCIVVLSWRNASDTVSCVKSIMDNVCTPFKLLVIDNHSSDGTFEAIKSELSFDGVYSGNDSELAAVLSKVEEKKSILVETGRNGGYAYGNNYGLQLAFGAGCDYVWIVNSDTVLKSDALTPMIECARQAGERCGFVGSVIMGESGKIECFGGGVVYPWLGRAKLIVEERDRRIYKRNFFLMGASLLVSKELYREVGLMDEEYFMYFEEVDWQMRAISQGYSLNVCQQSLIYHSGAERERSEKYYYYIARAGVLYAKKYAGHMKLFAACSILFTWSVANISKPARIISIFTGVMDGWRGKWSA